MTSRYLQPQGWVCRALCIFFVVASFRCETASAIVANAFHVPFQEGGEAGLGGAQMRQPHFEIGSNTTVTVISGIQRLDGAETNHNQTGGWLIYKAQTNLTWTSNALIFTKNSGNNQYWSNTFNTVEFAPEDVVEYYLELNFDNQGTNPPDTTFVFGNDSGSTASTNRTDAEADPSSIRNRPAFIFHANDRVLLPGNIVQFRAKTGFITQNQTQWADNGRLYYSTNGIDPEGALGVAGNGSTMVATMVFNNIVMDFSIAGQGMEWLTTVTNLPTFETNKYKMGFWHSDNNEEKFADYRAGTNNRIFSFNIATPGLPALTVNGLNAEYTASKFFIDENNSEKVNLTVVYDFTTFTNFATTSFIF